MQSCLKTYAILSLLLQVTIFFLIFVAKSIIQLSEVDMIKTKTIKTPLKMAVAFWPTSCSSGLVPKSTLLHNPEVQYGFVPKHSLHGGKNPALRAEKLIFAMRTFFSEAQRNGVFASDDVLRCGAMCGDVMVCAGACSQAQSHEIDTETRRAKTLAEGFLRFLLITET